MKKSFAWKPADPTRLVLLTLLAACTAGQELGGAGGGYGGGHGGQGGRAVGGGSGVSLGQGGGGGSPEVSITVGVGGGGDDAGACGHSLPATVRDFKNSHPDFTTFLGDDSKIVTHRLGDDGKPVYAGSPTTATTTGKANFDQWYRDVSEVNLPFTISLALTDLGGGIYSYSNSNYFPIDNQGFGDENMSHNYSFTTEIHTQFAYKGGEIFTFTGDDDVFVYINKRLVINLGGVHNPETTSVVLDAVASQIPLVVGNTYPLDIFNAERHPSGSNFRVDTTIECFVPVSVH